MILSYVYNHCRVCSWSLVLKPEQSKSFFLENVWWHDKVIVVPNVSFQGSNIRSFLLLEHHDAIYSGHVEVTKTWKRM